MAKKIKTKTQKKERFVFGSLNLFFMILAIVFIIVGYIIVNSAINLGAILLVIGYAILIPISLLIKSKKEEENPKIR